MGLVNDLIIRVGGKDNGGIGLMNRMGLEIRKNREELAGLQTVSMGFGAAGRVAMGGGMALGGALLWAGKQGGGFVQELRNANTMAKLNETQFAALGDSVLNIARDPQVLDGPQKLAAGLYDLYSSGIKGNDALTTLRAGAVGAAAANEDSAVAMGILSDVMNAYNQKTGPDSIRIMDQLWESVNIGKFRFGDLAGQIGPMVAVAAPLGVKLEEVAAATALLTNKGFSYSEAATAVERSMTAMLTPTDTLKKKMKELGYESAVEMLKARGLAGSINVITEAANGNQAELAAMYGNVRALRAAMTLGGASAGEYAQMMDQIKNSTGSAGRAAAEAEKGPIAQFRLAMKDLNTEVTDMAMKDLLPIGTEFIANLREGIAEFRALSPEQKKMIVDMAVGTTKALLLAGALSMVSGGLLNIIQLGGTVRGTLGGVMGMLRGGGGAAGAGAGAAADAAGGIAEGAGGIMGWLRKRQGAKVGRQVAGAQDAAARAGRIKTATADMKFFGGLNLPAGSGGWQRGFDAFKVLKDEGVIKGAKRAKVAITEVWSAQTKLAWANELAGSSSIKSGKAMWAWVSKGSNWTGLLGGMKNAAVGFGGALSKLPGALASIGSGLVSFLVSPAGIATLAIAALAVELGALWKSYKEMRDAQKQEKENKAQQRSAEDEKQAQGTWNFDSTARSLGYSEKDINRIQNLDSSDAEFKKISDLTQQRNAKTGARKAADRQQQRNQATADANMKRMQAEQAEQAAAAAPSTAPATPAAAYGPAAGAAIPAAAYGGPAAGSRTGQTADGQKVVYMTVYGNTTKEILQDVDSKLTEQFGTA